MSDNPTYMDCWHFIAPLIPVNTDYARDVYCMVFKALKDAEEKMKSMVAVVRCRDCIHRRGDETPMCMLHTEPYANARGYKGEAVCVEMNDFCSYGERRNRK